MKQALLIVDVQPSFPIPIEILNGNQALCVILPTAATVERHDESDVNQRRRGQNRLQGRRCQFGCRRPISGPCEESEDIRLLPAVGDSRV